MVLKMIKGNLFIHPDDMYPDDPYIIQREKQMFTLCKTESGEIQIFIEDDYKTDSEKEFENGLKEIAKKIYNSSEQTITGDADE